MVSVWCMVFWMCRVVSVCGLECVVRWVCGILVCSVATWMSSVVSWECSVVGVCCLGCVGKCGLYTLIVVKEIKLNNLNQIWL